MIEFEDDKEIAKRRAKASSIWVEKYRPLTVKATILSAKYRKFFNSIVQDQEIPNLLIHSNSPGSGKTTISKALANDCNYDVRYINTSLHRGIDTLRGEIEEYATARAPGKKGKVVILDECDGATDTLQRALRGAIEEFHDKCRFILTANTLSKIIEPLRSRLQVVNFDYTDADKKEMKPKIVKRLVGIAQKEEVEFEDGVMPALVDTFFPDIRKMINIMSEYSKQYDIIDEKIFNFSQIDEELADMILEFDFKGARKYILDSNIKHEEVYRYVFDKVIPRIDDGDCRGNLYMLTDDYLDKATRSWDQEITCTGFIYAVMDTLREYK